MGNRHQYHVPRRVESITPPHVHFAVTHPASTQMSESSETKKIRATEMRDWINDEGHTFVLLDCNPKQSHDYAHLPTALSADPYQDEFLEVVAGYVSSKDDEIVVYCAGNDCPNSPLAASKLSADGYTNIVEYSAGLMGWEGI